MKESYNYSKTNIQNVKHLLNDALVSISANISQYVVNTSKDFSRTRKLPAKTLIQFILNMEGNSLNAEIYKNFPDSKERMTASAFVQQRDKLNPEIFKQILCDFNATMTNLKTMKGLRVYAIDGSDFCTPTNKDSQWYIPNHYIRKDGQEAKGTCLLHGNFLYDILNKQYMNVNVTRDEREGAVQLIEDITNPKNALVIMDRGYSGFNMIEHCNRYGGYYVIRHPLTSTIKEITELPNEQCDKDISIKVSSKSQQFCDLYGYRKLNVHKGYKNEYSERTSATQWDFEDKCVVRFRLCKFRINDPDSGKQVWEVLVTNLPRDKFDLKDMKRIITCAGV